jgi:hypothetical protein
MRTAFYWRLKPQFYRLQGVRYENGELSLQERPFPPKKEETQSNKAEVAEVTFQASLYLKNAS